MKRHSEADMLAEALKDRQLRVVFAESCTAGLVAGLLAAVPGISAYLCGSMVTYRDDSKHRWLSIPSTMLRRHTAVSSLVTERMATDVLRQTPEANLAAAVTGHLGPDAPPDMDGLCFVVVAQRVGDDIEIVHQSSRQLAESSRIERQHEAACYVLTCVTEAIRSD